MIETVDGCKILNGKRNVLICSDKHNIDFDIIHKHILKYNIDTVDMSNCKLLKEIPKNAFFYNSNLKNIILPKYDKNKGAQVVIGEAAFKGSTLEHIINSENIKQIQKDAFYMSALSDELVLGNECVQIEKNALSNTKLKSIIVNGEIEKLENCFSYNKHLKKIVFAKKIGFIKDAFTECINLEKINLDKVEKLVVTERINSPKLCLNALNLTKFQMSEKYHSLKSVLINSSTADILMGNNLDITTIGILQGNKKYKLNPKNYYLIRVFDNNIMLNKSKDFMILSDRYGKLNVNFENEI